MRNVHTKVDEGLVLCMMYSNHAQPGQSSEQGKAYEGRWPLIRRAGALGL